MACPVSSLRITVATGAQQQVEMVGNQRPGKTARLGLLEHPAQPLDKIIAVLVVGKDLFALDTLDNDMMQRSGGVDAGLSGHAA